MEQIRKNIDKVRSQIAAHNNQTQLVAVSKYRTKEEIIEACKAGQRVFGENRVQEALSKWPEIKQQYPDVTLHLIGHLQTNKIHDALKIFDVIEVVDRKKLADKLKIEIGKLGRNVGCYIQVNTGDEPQKSGVNREEAEDLIEYCKLLGLKVSGLMCIPPADHPSELHFNLLKEIATKHDLHNLSMGMSNDYETAIACGATHIRVGTAIFGARPHP